MAAHCGTYNHRTDISEDIPKYSLYICRIFLLSSLSIILYMHTAFLSISQHLPQGTVTSEKKAYSLIFVLKQARAILCCRGDANRSIITRFRDSHISETVSLPTPRLEFRTSVQKTFFITDHRELLTSCFSICTVPFPRPSLPATPHIMKTV
jgi:hypothetical protein